MVNSEVRQIDYNFYVQNFPLNKNPAQISFEIYNFDCWTFAIKEVISIFQETGNVDKLKLVITAENILIYSLSVMYVHGLTDIWNFVVKIYNYSFIFFVIIHIISFTFAFLCIY